MDRFALHTLKNANSRMRMPQAFLVGRMAKRLKYPVRSDRHFSALCAEKRELANADISVLSGEKNRWNLNIDDRTRQWKMQLDRHESHQPEVKQSGSEESNRKYKICLFQPDKTAWAEHEKSRWLPESTERVDRKTCPERARFSILSE